MYTAIKHGLSMVLLSFSLGQDMQNGTNIPETMGLQLLYLVTRCNFSNLVCTDIHVNANPVNTKHLYNICTLYKCFVFAGKRKEVNKRSQRRYMGLYIKLSFKWENKGHIIEVQVQVISMDGV